MLPFGLWWQWFGDVWEAAELEAELRGLQALAGDAVLLLRGIARPMAMSAGVTAIMTEQANSAATAVVADEYSTMLTEIGRNPYYTEALNVTVTAHDLECGSRKPQIGKVGVF
jgi:hypothetical protein